MKILDSFFHLLTNNLKKAPFNQTPLYRLLQSGKDSPDVGLDPLGRNSARYFERNLFEGFNTVSGRNGLSSAESQVTPTKLDSKESSQCREVTLNRDFKQGKLSKVDFDREGVTPQSCSEENLIQN